MLDTHFNLNVFICTLEVIVTHVTEWKWAVRNQISVLYIIMCSTEFYN